jgi:DNA primase
MNRTDKINLIKKIGIKIDKESSSGEIQCFCPLHDDHEPSLMININTGKYQCFSGCIRGRSLEDLVKKITGRDIYINSDESWGDSFKEKLYPKTKSSILPSIPLLPLAVGNPGEEYLISNKRKLDLNIISEFKIMYWEQRNAVVVPIENVGYMIRDIDGKKFKYVNGTRINDTLFGLEKINLKSNVFIILVEGCFDKLWLHKIGYKNSLAIMHGGISDRQVEILNWFQVPIYIMMDNDENGEGNKIRDRISNRLRGKFRVKICELPRFKDPNESTEIEIAESIESAH